MNGEGLGPVRLVDLTEPMIPREQSDLAIEPIDHAMAAERRSKRGGFALDDLPLPGIHFASERVIGQVHGSGTHVDAPWHYGPQSEGRRARTIDELPLEWFFGDGVVLDFSDRQDGGTVATEEIVSALGNHPLRPRDIVLVRTDLMRADGGKRELRELSREAVEYLLDCGVKVVGIDAPSAELAHVEELSAGRPERYFPVHCLGREREYCLVEQLTNLHLLPPRGFQVALFPVKLHRGSGGWCRAVAFLREDGPRPG